MKCKPDLIRREFVVLDNSSFFEAACISSKSVHCLNLTNNFYCLGLFIPTEVVSQEEVVN